MAEFEEIKKFIRDNHKLNVIDITKNLSIDSYKNYCAIAIKNSNNVYIAKRTIKSNKLFTLLTLRSTNDTNKSKYLLIKNDNYHTTSKFSKAYISRFVTGNDREIYECGICYNHSLSNNICDNCTFNVCGYCVKSLYLSNNLNCPQCKQKFEIYDNELVHEIRKNEENYKLNI
jgi:hypothetical protein